MLRTLPLLLSVLLVVCACLSMPAPTPMPGENELPFETIEKGYDSSYDKPGELALVTVTDVQEIERLGDWISAEAHAQLQDLDYEAEFVVAVFRGYFSEGCCGLDIHRVGRRGNQVVVYTELRVNRGPRVQAVNSPYQLIKIRRDGEPISDVALLTWTVYRP